MSKVLNNFLCSLAIFGLSFLWTYYSLKSAVWAAALAATVAVCSSYLIYRAQNKLGQIKNVKSQNKKAVAGLREYLRFNDDNSSVFAELYRYYGYEVNAVDFDSFTASKEDASTFVTLCFRSDVLTTDDAAKAIVAAKRSKADKLCVYAVKIDTAARKAAAAQFDVSFVDLENAYLLLEQSGKLPRLPQAKPPKSSFAAKYAFCRKRFGWYLASSVFTALLSIVAYFPYYLLGWATVLLALALYSLFNTRYNAKQTNVRLD